MENKETVQSEQKDAAQTSDKAELKAENSEDIVVTKSAEELAKRLKEVSQEAKQYRQRLAEEKRERENLQRKSLEEQGQFKELADIYKSKAEAAEAQSKKLRDAFAMKSVSDSVAVEAAKLGCVDTDALVQLMPLEQIPIGDGFSVDKGHVRTIMEEFKRQKPYLFQKQAPKIPDVTPAAPEKPSVDVELAKLSISEKAALLSRLKNQGK